MKRMVKFSRPTSNLAFGRPLRLIGLGEFNTMLHSNDANADREGNEDVNTFYIDEPPKKSTPAGVKCNLD